MQAISNYTNERTAKTPVKRMKINPAIKSAVYDYLLSDFLTLAVPCIALFFIGIIQFTEGLDYLYEIKNQSAFFIAMTIIFFIGFMGICSSIPNINWKFQAIISPSDFKYHAKRTIFFLGGFFGWLLVIFIFVGSMINPALMLKYLLCIIVLFLATIFISLTFFNAIIKFLLLIFIAALTIWVSTMPSSFLLILAVPVLAAFLKAKDDYREWYLL
jgi:hypothetical protein